MQMYMLRPKGAQKQVRLKCEIRLTFEVFFTHHMHISYFQRFICRRRARVRTMFRAARRYIFQGVRGSYAWEGVRGS
jgi:hypothetical protein